jgi:ribosomal protein L18E
VTVEGINVTKGAKESIEKAGGKIEEIEPKDRVEKKELKNEDTDK